MGGESRGPRPFHASAISVVGRRPPPSPRRKPGSTSLGVGGAWFPAFAGMTGGGSRPYSVSPAKAGVHVPSTLRPSQWFTGGPTPSPRRKPGSTSPPRFGYLSGSPAPPRLPGESRGPHQWLVVSGRWLVAGVHAPGGWGCPLTTVHCPLVAWFPAFAGMTGGGRKPGSTSLGVGGAWVPAFAGMTEGTRREACRQPYRAI